MKLIRQILVAALLAGASASAMAVADKTVTDKAATDKVVNYTIDPAHSFVHFSWSHVGFSNPMADFTQVNGTIMGNQTHPEKSSVSVTMPVKSLDTHVPLLNEHLIDSGDYFKSKEFPGVTFKSTGIKALDKKKKTFQLLGELTVNGISKPVVLQATLNKAGPHPFYENADAAGFNATTRLKRSAFGIDKFVPMVSDELDVTITVEAIEAVAFQKMLDKQKADAAKK
ncbi:MAG: YceI family protein [bacterium]|nr:YceI family protein [bacterium]